MVISVATEKRRFDEDDYVVNIGPNHPSTHGVLRLQTVIDGETVKRIYPHPVISTVVSRRCGRT